MTEPPLPTHRPPTHPGEMLLEEFLKPAGVSIKAFAETIGVSYPRMHEVIAGKRPMTPDTAQRVARATGMSLGFWRQLQLQFDLWHRERTLSDEVKSIRPHPAFIQTEEPSVAPKPEVKVVFVKPVEEDIHLAPSEWMQ